MTNAPADIHLMGMRLDVLTREQTVLRVADSIAAGKGGVAITANLDHLRRYQSDGAYRSITGHAELVVADGMPLVWASRLRGTPLPERVAGSDLIFDLTAELAKRGQRLVLLGGNPGAAEGAAKELCARYEGLVVARTICPPMGFEDDETYMRSLIKELAEAEPDLVYVALGSPKQELVIDRLRRESDDALSSVWWMGVGISFSFVTGEVSRAPKFLQAIGFEWAHRLLQEPKRLAHRYLVQGVPFAAHLFVRSFFERFSKRG